MAEATSRQIELAEKYLLNNPISSTSMIKLSQHVNNYQNGLHVTPREKICALCGAYANMRCSQCKATWYCSIDHQHKHWPITHSKECKPITQMSESSNNSHKNNSKPNGRPKKRGFFANTNQTKYIKQNNINSNEYIPPSKKMKLNENQENITLKKQNIQLQKQHLDLIQNINVWSQKHSLINQKYNVLKQQNQHITDCYGNMRKMLGKLQQENINYSKQLESNKELIVNKHKLQINVPNLSILGLSELTELETHMDKGLNEVRDVKNKFIENKYLCIICCKNERNISFSSCKHLVICTECEKKLESKKCPVCQQSYFFVSQLQF